MFTTQRIPDLPVCKVVRFNIEYNVLYFEEKMPENFTIRQVASEFRIQIWIRILFSVENCKAWYQYKNSCFLLTNALLLSKVKKIPKLFLSFDYAEIRNLFLILRFGGGKEKFQITIKLLM